MVAGYVRLSRDDDRKNYTSIENQMTIINRYAMDVGLKINRWYEDDGISGYSFNRPGFDKLLADLDKDIDTIIAKDLSRIGRHNAKVLLLLDELKENGKRLILVDDNYDTCDDEDDIIGIKTWYNERYVKDTSRKIKKVIRARQQEGTLMIPVPVGYKRKEENKREIDVVEEEAIYVRRVFDLYLQGFGYRRIAELLTSQGVPTPSMLLRERSYMEGKEYKRPVCKKWSDRMVSDILKNDFYKGYLRLKKRMRTTINGRDNRVPKENQLIFKNDHKAIIDESTFDLVQEIMKKRIRSNYRGQTATGTIFGGCLYCNECQSRLTPILRKQNNRRYYICNTYNTKGKTFCSHSHMIYEEDLIDDVVALLKLCKQRYYKEIGTYNLPCQDLEYSMKERRVMLEELIDRNKKQLVILISQKIKEINEGMDESLIKDTYLDIQKRMIDEIHDYQRRLEDMDSRRNEIDGNQKKSKKPLHVLDRIINSKALSRKDVEFLIEKITVDEMGFPEIELKFDLKGIGLVT